jgi:2'-5' RNA ligase
VYSLNVPIPGQVARVAADLRPRLTGFDRIRDRHTLVLKRLGDLDHATFSSMEKAVRQVLDGAPAVEAAVTGIDAFQEPVTGPAPVVYLAVDSPGLFDLHRRLLEVVDPVAGLEGPDYVPHVTLARGGDSVALERVLQPSIEPVSWTVTTLEFWDAGRNERAGRLSLPG